FHNEVGLEIPVDERGDYLINYYKRPQDYFPTYSVVDFIDGRVPANAYRDKIVLFGMTAIGLFDLRPTPFGPQTPGVYIHAAGMQAMLDGLNLVRSGEIALAEIGLFIVLALFMGLLF